MMGRIFMETIQDISIFPKKIYGFWIFNLFNLNSENYAIRENQEISFLILNDHCISHCILNVTENLKKKHHYKILDLKILI